MTKKTTTTKLEVHAYALLEKDYARFKSEVTEKMGEELPEYVAAMLEMAFKCGYQDGCIALGEQIAEAMGGNITKSFSDN